MKDNFSAQANQYALFRPTYPDAFFEYLQTLLPHKICAWDCGTGNGQVAVQLSNYFTQVYATDISQAQLQQAPLRPNIHYSQQPAEKTNFPDKSFDLIIVAQAIHWFHFEQFYAEVTRTAKSGAMLVVIGYGKLQINPAIDAIINRLYYDIVGPYWDKERRYIDENYQTIPFPFEEHSFPSFSNHYDWTLSHLLGYLNTWSAVQHYTKAQGHNPVDLITNDLQQAWGNAPTITVSFPLLLRGGRVV